jgi:nitrate reductase gamma subunit
MAASRRSGSSCTRWLAFGLFALWPFTRLVHVFSAPVGYLTRPYIVYRSRDDSAYGSTAGRRGWDKVGS